MARPQPVNGGPYETFHSGPELSLHHRPVADPPLQLLKTVHGLWVTLQRRSHCPCRLGVSPARRELGHTQEGQSRLKSRAQRYASSIVEPGRPAQLPVLPEVGQLLLMGFYPRYEPDWERVASSTPASANVKAGSIRARPSL